MNAFLQMCIAVYCLSMVGMHLAKRNMNEIMLYAIQSLVITALLGLSVWRHGTVGLWIVMLLTLAVKVIAAPLFFARLVRHHELKQSASMYASSPITLAALLVMLLLAGSDIFAPLTHLASAEYRTFAVLVIAGILASILLIANRKGALSQAIGILSLENSIVAFTLFVGLEQSPIVEIGIIFDVFVWLVIATVFVGMVYKHFQTIDVTSMKHLKG